MPAPTPTTPHSPCVRREASSEWGNPIRFHCSRAVGELRITSAPLIIFQSLKYIRRHVLYLKSIIMAQAHETGTSQVGGPKLAKVFYGRIV